MDEFEIYWSWITQLTHNDERISDYDSIELVQRLMNYEPQQFVAMKNIRKSLLSASDYNDSAFLMSAIFDRLEYDERAVLFTIAHEIAEENWRFHHCRKFEKYRPNHPIFQKEPGLFDGIRTRDNGNPDGELIRLDALQYEVVSGNHTCQFNNSFLEVDGELPPEVVGFLLDKYPRSQLYIRVNPYVSHDEAPPLLFLEEQKQPPNPYWVRNMGLFPGGHEGCEFFLDEIDVSQVVDEDTRRKFWERKFKRIIKLDVIARLRQGNHFSMMLEELSEEYLDMGLLVGRIIHLDSTNITPFGQSFGDCRLNHLDLAYQLYVGDNISIRRGETLASGSMVTNADYRIHLFRADGIMLSHLLDIAQLFFKSRSLTTEWIQAQFHLGEL